jgi:hypothetical protein
MEFERLGLGKKTYYKGIRVMCTGVGWKNGQRYLTIVPLLMQHDIGNGMGIPIPITVNDEKHLSKTKPKVPNNK